MPMKWASFIVIEACKYYRRKTWEVYVLDQLAKIKGTQSLVQGGISEEPIAQDLNLPLPVDIMEPPCICP